MILGFDTAVAAEHAATEGLIVPEAAYNIRASGGAAP
jgi:hypothetical protein